MHAHGTCITFTSAELLVLLLVLRLVLQVCMGSYSGGCQLHSAFRGHVKSGDLY